MSGNGRDNGSNALSDALSVTRRRLNGALVVSVGGEVDLANVQSLQEHLKTAAEAAPNLVIDLRNLRYIDSCGIKALLDAHRFFARGGRSIVLAGLSPSARRVFEILEVHQAMSVFPTVEAAVESLHNGKKT